MLVGLDRNQFGELTALNHFRQVFLLCFPNMLLSIKSNHQRRSFNTITEDIKDIVTAGPTVFTWAPIFACGNGKGGKCLSWRDSAGCSHIQIQDISRG